MFSSHELTVPRMSSDSQSSLTFQSEVKPKQLFAFDEDLKQTNDDNLPKLKNGSKMSRLGFKSRKHANRTDIKKCQFPMSMSPSSTARRTDIASMQSLMSPSPFSLRKYTSINNSVMSLSPVQAVKRGFRSIRSMMLSPSPSSLQTDNRGSLSRLYPSPIAVRKNMKSIRPITSTSPIARSFNLVDSPRDVSSSRQHSARHHVLDHKRNSGKFKRSPEVMQLFLDSPVHAKIEECDAVTHDVMGNNNVITNEINCEVIDNNNVIKKDIHCDVRENSDVISSDNKSLEMSYDACSSSNADGSSTEMTGDFTRELCLPVCPTKLSDLNAISPTTAMKVMKGEYSHVIDNFLIIDCRYPYEYEGGHIKEARNFSHISNCEDMLQTAILSQYSEQLNKGKKTVVILHCEFSQMRGPTMARHLRNIDRTANGSSYPALHYPEIYVIEGGYKAFHARYQEQCIPQEYVPMDHPKYSTELAFHRSKSTKNTKTSRRGVRSTKFSLDSPMF